MKWKKVHTGTDSAGESLIPVPFQEKLPNVAKTEQVYKKSKDFLQ